MRLRVVCGRGEAIAIFCPRIWLSSVDLPTFGRPTSPMYPARCTAGLIAWIRIKIRKRSAYHPGHGNRGDGVRDLATLLGLNPAFFLGALPLGVIALVLGIVGYKMAKQNGQPTGTATAGIVLGSTGVAFSVLMWIMCHMLVTGAKNAVEKTGKSFAEPFKKIVAEAEAKAKAERDPGLPLDRAHAIKVTAERLSQELDENGAAAEKKYMGRTLEVTGEIDSVDKHWGKEEYLDITILGWSTDQENSSADDVTCKLITADNARALALKKGHRVTVIGVADTTLGADLRGCVIK